MNIIKNKDQTLNSRNNIELRINFLSKTFLKFLKNYFSGRIDFEFENYFSKIILESFEELI